MGRIKVKENVKHFLNSFKKFLKLTEPLGPVKNFVQIKSRLIFEIVAVFDFAH